MMSDYLWCVDDKWFKAQQKRVGVTADDIARRMGRSRSNVSHILTGKQRMSLEWAKVFAEVLQVPVSEVLERAGALEPETAQQLRPGFSESDAAVWIPKGAEDRQVPTMAAAMGARPGVDVWQVRSAALALMGYMPGDFMLVDSHAAERVRAGDVVVAQVYDNAQGSATTVLRRFEPPVLVAASMEATERRVQVVDGINVVIRGKVVACWRVP